MAGALDTQARQRWAPGWTQLATEPLDRVAGEPFGLVDDDQLEQGRVGAVYVVEVAAVEEEVFLNAVCDAESTSRNRS